MKKNKWLMTLVLAFTAIAAMSSLKFTKAIDEDLILSKPDGLTINAVNELSWESVSNATGYKYRVSGGDWIYTANPKADLNSEISQAVKSAFTNNNTSAEIIAEVKAVAAGITDSEVATFTHSFTDYTDVSKLSNFSDYVSIQEEGLLVNSNPIYTNVINTNEIMTVAFKAESLSTKGSRAYQFYFLNSGYNYAYIFRFRLDSLAGPWYLQKLVSNETAASTILSSVALDNFKDNKYYISFGALNILNFSGETTGERYYLKVWTYGQDGLPVVVLENAHDFTNLSSRLTARKNNLEIKDLDASANMSFKLFSTGNDKLSAPINLYYDNVAERVYWESKTVGSAYKWNINGGAWNYTNKNYADVASILNSIRNSNYKDVTFKVVSVSATAGLNDSNANVLNFNAKLDASTSLAQKDLIDCINYNGSLGVKEDVKEKFFPELDSEWMPAGKHIYQGNGINKNEFLNFSLKYSLDNSETQIYSIFYDSAYNDGHNIEILRNETGKGVRVRFKLNGNKDYYSFSGEPLQLNIKYTVSMGVFDIFDTDTGDKTAERMVVKITTKTEDGLDKTVLYAERDYTSEFYKSGDKIYLQKFSSNTQYYSYMKSFPQNEYRILINVDNQLPFKEFVVKYEEYYNLENLNLEAMYGYKITRWYYLDKNQEKKYIDSKGLWKIDFKEEVEDMFMGIIYAETEPIKFNISYVIQNAENNINNPDLYFFGTKIELSNPENIVNGKIFAGWYSDSGFTKSVSVLENINEDITLYAKFVDGWKITVKTLNQNLYFNCEAGEIFTLPEILLQEGYSSYKFKIFEETGFVDYNEKTIKPNKDLLFEVVYEYKNYSINYVLDGGTNNQSNSESYNIGSTKYFEPATKENHYFDGWYLDENFSNRILNTENITGNITIYAKFIIDNLPSNITLYKSALKKDLPLPILPDGSSFTIALFSSDSEEPLELDENNQYVFDIIGDYILKYNISQNGQQEIKMINIKVIEKIKISLAGDYQDSYKAGTVLEILKSKSDSNLGNISIKILKDGKEINATDSIKLEKGNYKISYISDDSNVEPLEIIFEVENASSSNTIIIILASIIVLAAIAYFLKTKKK